ncbi:MAG: hypothetical protein JWO95_453 [Verrucomicrobiales bacterium]|nr:hypothetical protein [Verrucomicrobiales bacterium]
MRSRAWIIILLGLNVLLFGAWLVARHTSAKAADATVTTNAPGETLYRTNVVVRRQNFTWEEVESVDYVTYIKNLRSIGCPEKTIRDIIVADVNQLYSHRRVTEVVAPEQQWWRSDPNPELIDQAAAKVKELETERKTLLTKLLGPGWDTESNALPPARTGVSLTGPILGDIAPAAKQFVYDAAVRAQQRIDSYQEAQRQADKPIDPREIAKIRQDLRDELAKVLNQQQMEEYQLRYSPTANQLRDELHGMDLNPDEFRALYKERDQISNDPDLYYAGDDATRLQHRAQLEAQRDDTMRRALGGERYAVYELNRDPVFRQSKATAERLNVPAESIIPIYQINRLTQSELERIRSDDTMTNEEKVEALAAAQVEQQKSLEKILGPEAFQRWLETQNK